MANNTNADPRHVVTNKVRLSYCHLTEPYKSQLADANDKPKYSVTLLIPKTDQQTMDRIRRGIQVAGERGLASGKLKKGTPIDKLPQPVHDGDGFKEDGYTPYGDECKGMWVMTASDTQPPKIVDMNRNPIIDAAEIYSGMWARVSVDFFVYANRKVGIGCSLGNVQKVADGEPLGATKASVDSDFGDDYEDDPLA